MAVIELSESRYRQLLEKAVFSGHFSLSDPLAQQIATIRIYGNSIPQHGIKLQTDIEMWEAEQVLKRIGDLQHELGPPSLTDHLKILDLSAMTFELKRFYARTEFGTYPQRPAMYRIPTRTLLGQVHYFDVPRSITRTFKVVRDVDSLDIYESNSWLQNTDFNVPSNVVTCLRLPDGPAVSTIGLGFLRDLSNRSTGFFLVWLLTSQKYGIVYDYTHRRYDSDESDTEDFNYDYRREVVDPGVRFSIATLEGDYRLGDGQDPQKELATQLDQDITFFIKPFAYNGFKVEDACRYQGVIQPLDKDIVAKAVLEYRK